MLEFLKKLKESGHKVTFSFDGERYIVEAVSISGETKKYSVNSENIVELIKWAFINDFKARELMLSMMEENIK